MNETAPTHHKITRFFWYFAAVMVGTITLLLFIKNDPFHSASTRSIVIYKVLPLLVTALCVFIATRQPDFRLKFMLLGSSVVLCSLLMEIGLITVWQGDPILNMKRFQRKHHGVLGKKWEHLDQLRKRVNPAYLYVTPIFHTEDKYNSKFNLNGDIIFPVNGISKARVVMDNEGQGYAAFDADEYGFNNPVGSHDMEKADVVLLGDSFVMGCCVEPGEELGSLIRKSFSKTVNLGRNGTGPLLQLGIFAEYAPALKPKNVVFFYYEGNDIKDLEIEFRTKELHRYMDPGFRQNLKQIQPFINNRYKQLHSTLREDYFSKERSDGSKVSLYSVKDIVKFIELRKFLGLTYKGIDSKNYPPEFETIMLDLKKRTESWGGKLTVVYLPYYTRLFKRDDGPLFFGQQVRAFFEKNNFDVIDIEALFKKDADPPRFLPFRGPGHLNADGYREVANAVVNHLQKGAAL